MLDLKQIDLRSLREALEDHSNMTEWWLDPQTGQVEPWLADPDFAVEVGEEHPADRDWIRIEPIPSRASYGDLEDFIERVRDPRARELLERAIGGRGAFRRFKDTLLEFPELRESWFRFHDARMERRAIRWLADEGLVEEAAAEKAIRERPDPEPPPPAADLDAVATARAVARDLRELYGERLHRVLLFGSWARGDAHPESDIDLLVVLDHVDSVWEELRRMDETLWRHSFENDTVVSAVVVDESSFREPEVPAIIRAKIEGRTVA